MAHAPKFIRDWFTEDDAGQIWSMMHAASAAVISSGLGLQIYDVVGLHHQFDIQTFGMGAAGILSGCGAGIFANAKSGTKP
jgi:hypothetical protein